MLDRKTLIEIGLELLGVLLVILGATFDEVFFLAWIGVPLVVITLYYHYHRISKEKDKTVMT